MSISSHIDEFNKLIADLLNLSETFKVDSKAILLIGSLLDELGHLVLPLFMGRKKYILKKFVLHC